MAKSQGIIRHDPKKNMWVIECAPHVAIRLKRVFARINTYDFGTLRLSATPENSFDLQWFLQRYPMVVENPGTLSTLAARHERKATLIEEILAGSLSLRKFDLKLPLREYQAHAVEMWYGAGGLLLADDVGLGKTAVCCGGVIDPRLRPALVVCQTHLPYQWRDQFHKFTDLRVHILKKSTPYNLAADGRMPDVIISNYHKLAGWAETLAPLIKSVTFDEVQELRHRDTNKYLAARHITENVEFRLGLSATPIYNYGGEIFNVISMLSPDALGEWAEFQREWCIYDDQKPIIRDTKAFGIYAREAGLMLRRTRKEVKRELPEVTVVPHYIEAKPDAILALKGKAIELAKLILAQKETIKGQKMRASGEFDMKMRQATGISKAPFVAQFVKFLVEENDEPVVLFGWHREVYNIWMEELKSLRPVLYTGTESPKEKEESKQKFLKGESKVLIISLRAGAGMDGLQDICHVAVFGELDWSPGVHEQCIGRIHRDGQDDPCTAYYLLSDSGSDPIISDVLGIKKQQIEGIRDPNQELVTKLQTDGDHIKRLAEKFLRDNGVEIPKSEEDTSIVP
jgi:SNF2 family DNA or RNA helicase